VLDSMQETIARRFASWDVAEKFRGLAYRTETSGAPVLEIALAWLDCKVSATYPAGDHTIYIGEVLSGDAREGPPLLFYRGGYGRFTP
jgi:flavin reductase (DIM6/NTAB) family NADH-FMN oxidoreductase RutF